jgi:hypothetical protein
MKKPKPVLIVSATKGKKEDTRLYSSLTQTDLAKKSYKLEMYEDNKTGLPELYNKHLNKETLAKHDVVLFIHDDVYIDDSACFSKIGYAMRDEGGYGFDIVGLAGGRDISIKKPALWHLMSSSKFGTVVHPADNLPDSARVSANCFGPSPERCLVLDGLFLAVNLQRAIDVDWKFNESFTFHHYDIASCIDANTKKLKLGVYPIWVVHSSPGLQDYWDESFQESQKKFLELYGTD